MSRTLLTLLLLPMLALAAPPAELAAEPGTAVPTEDIQRYVAVYRAIKHAYVEPMSDRELMRAAARGLLGGLDPHSAYLPREEAEQMSEQTTGNYVGIGVEIEQRPDRSLAVVAAIDGTPAARAGLKTGDVILAINGKAIDGEHADAASLKLRGEAGSTLVLTLLGAGKVTPRDVTIKRELIRIASVSSRLLEPGYGYLRISNFQTDTGPQVGKQLAALATQSSGSLQGVVLDLRSNPGGLLNAAVEAADAFLERGIIVSTKGRLSYANAEYRAKAGDASAGAALVVLIDSGTASAAEVLAGALRDHKRATLMGSRSFGKGSIQTIVPLDNGDAVKLTTARYYTPNGKSIQASGIKPDIRLRGKAARGLREQDLARHIRGEGETADGYALGEVIEGDEAIRQALAQLRTQVAARAVSTTKR